MSPKLKIALVILSVFIVVFCSSYKLTESPPLWYDEGMYDQIALNNSLYGVQEMQVAPGQFVSSAFVTGGYPFIQPISWSFSIFGIGVLQSRIVMVVFIVACMTALGWLIYRLFGFPSALAAVFLSVTFPVLYGDGKSVLGEVPGLFYLFCFLICVYEIEKKHYTGMRLWYILAGVSAGLCVSTKPLFLVLGGAVLISIYIHKKSIRFNWKSLSVGLVSFVIPLVLWAFFQFGGADSVSQVLGYYANPYGISDMGASILTNFLRFFTEASPVYFVVMALIWIGAYVIRTRHGVPITLAEKIAFTFSILVSLAYLRTAGWYRYFFVAEVITIAFVPYSLSLWGSFLEQKGIMPSRIVRPVVALVFVIFLGIQTYQLMFTSWVAEHYSSKRTHDLEQYLASQDVHALFFVYNIPELVMLLPNNLYYQYMAPTDSLTFGSEQIEVLRRGVPDILFMQGRDWDSLEKEFPLYVKTDTVGGMYVMKKRATIN